MIIRLSIRSSAGAVSWLLPFATIGQSRSVNSSPRISSSCQMIRASACFREILGQAVQVFGEQLDGTRFRHFGQVAKEYASSKPR